ncbi:MAG: glycine cleavage T C-terminal barrel domain-containing protein [Phycisphaerales bacterium]
MSPTLDVPIAMAIVAIASATTGTAVEIDFGRERVAGEVVPLPFYKASKS